jgi:transposase-like protein
VPAGLDDAADKADRLSRQQKFDLARRLLAESANNHTWVASQIGVNATTLWRWRKLGKI